jgi:hypothetical protein
MMGMSAQTLALQFAHFWVKNGPSALTQVTTEGFCRVWQERRGNPGKRKL